MVSTLTIKPSCDLHIECDVCTINSQECGPGLAASLVGDSTGVLTTVSVSNTRDDQHAAPPAHWRGQDAQVRPDVLAMEGPGDAQWFVSHHGNTTQLGKVALINNILAEGQWDQLGRN